MEKRQKHLLIYVITIVAIIGSLGYLNFYTATKLRIDYTSQLNTLQQAIITSNEKLNDNINIVNDNLVVKSDSLQSNIDDQNLLFTNMLNTLKSDNEEKDKNLLSLISELEKDSEIKLDALKSDLEGEISNIKVKSADFSSIIEDIIESVVSVLTDKGQGSGAFITNNGHIITNYHVIDSASIIRVQTYDKKLHDVKMIGADSDGDIAVLKIENETYPRLTFEDSDNVRVGEKVIAVGNPGGFDFTVTEGIVSAINRRASNSHLYVQTDVPINPGNSGGPLLNTKGRIVGINNFKIRGFEGIGFALNADIADQISDDLISG